MAAITAADMPSARGYATSCRPSAPAAAPRTPALDTRRPAAVDTIRAGTWLTSPSPTVSSV